MMRARRLFARAMAGRSVLSASRHPRSLIFARRFAPFAPSLRPVSQHLFASPRAEFLLLPSAPPLSQKQWKGLCFYSYFPLESLNALALVGFPHRQSDALCCTLLLTRSRSQRQSAQQGTGDDKGQGFVQSRMDVRKKSQIFGVQQHIGRKAAMRHNCVVPLQALSARPGAAHLWPRNGLTFGSICACNHVKPQPFSICSSKPPFGARRAGFGGHRARDRPPDVIPICLRTSSSM